MSVYCYLSCVQCKETMFVKDRHSEVHADPNQLGYFLEKHCKHPLIFTNENQGFLVASLANKVLAQELTEYCPAEDYERFKPKPASTDSL